MFIVTVKHHGNRFFLRATVWTGAAERATRYETQEAAQEGLAKAKPFMAWQVFRAAYVARPSEVAAADATN